jgi:hypothetical protein
MYGATMKKTMKTGRILTPQFSLIINAAPLTL